MSIDIITLGCRLNTYESEVMRAKALEAGLENAVIVNTCAVTGEAVRQARQSIRRARKDNPDARIIVTGCAVQTDPEAFAGMPEVDKVLGNADKLQSASYRLEALSERVVVNDHHLPIARQRHIQLDRVRALIGRQCERGQRVLRRMRR